MGIKTTITQKELPLKYQDCKLVETTNGITHSVYLLGTKYVLKIFEDITKQQVLNEQNLLNSLENKIVPKLIDIIVLKGKISAIYTQLHGVSVVNPEIIHIKQITLFLKQFHSKTTKCNSSNMMIFSRSNLEILINKSDNISLGKYFKNINCTLQNNGIIHGDLFIDNVKFKNDKLTGVYDFSEACNGDFLFDLATIAISWCFNDNKIDRIKVDILIQNYDDNIKYINFKEYIKYALLYYATTRYINNNNYKSLLNKLEDIK